MGSTNGTLVNGQPVKKHFLQSSDTVEIGKYKLKYMNEAPASMNQAEFEKTMVLRAPAAAAPKQEVRSPTDTQTNLQVPPNLSDATANAQPGPAAIAAVPPVSAPSKTAASVSAALPPSPQPAPPVAPPAAPAAAGATAQGIGTIQILSGPNAGKELPLTKPQIGRASWRERV